MTGNRITVNVDVTNPGQFFACCGLLVLADRLWKGVEGGFDESNARFSIDAPGDLKTLIRSLLEAEFDPVDESDPYSTPIRIGAPFRTLEINWWVRDLTGAKDLKVWAGTMESFGIAAAMRQALSDPRFALIDLFDVGVVVTVPNDVGKKKEPFYFDARRAPNAHARDVGFSANDLDLKTIAHPAVELLCLVGLQVARPVRGIGRHYDYATWSIPLPAWLIAPAAAGRLTAVGERRYRFENWFRTGQKKHKAFRTAQSLDSGV